MIYENVSQLIGKTPVIELKNIENGLGAKILAKLNT